MNFLEELVAEWYQFKGYFVQRNIKIGRLSHGGYEGEMDVLAFSQSGKEFLHIETSTDAMTWHRRKERFAKKFASADKQYASLFGRKPNRKIVVVGLGRTAKQSLGEGVEAIPIPEFVQHVCSELVRRNPVNAAIPEHFPLLRAMQYAVAYGAPTPVEA